MNHKEKLKKLRENKYSISNWEGDGYVITKDNKPFSSTMHKDEAQKIVNKLNLNQELTDKEDKLMEAMFNREDMDKIAMELFNKKYDRLTDEEQEEVDDERNKKSRRESFKESDSVDTLTIDIPLITRLFEYILENKISDEDLHRFLEQLILVSKSANTLTMNNYDEIIKKPIPLQTESFKEAKDKYGKQLPGGARVITPDGQKGYVYQIFDDDVRVSQKPQSGLIGWFKGNELILIESYKEKLKNLREYARTIDVDGQKIVAEISGSGNKAFTLDGEDKEYHLINGKWEEVKK